MLKNRTLAGVLDKRMLDYFYSKGVNPGRIELRPFKPWVIGLSDADYVDKVKTKFLSVTDSKNDMINKMHSLNDDFHGEDEVYQGRVHKMILFDYDMFVVVRESTGEALAVYLLHENPLSHSQIANIKSKLGMSFREIDHNIGELS